jgi:endonuclease/exonuclease/phosphatase (EEP) superfamily protein YafD
MIGALALGCFVTGFAVAWILRTAFTMAETSWWLKRMQYKVRYWQSQAALARVVAERLNHQLTDLTGQEPVALDWPRAPNSGEEDWPW